MGGSESGDRRAAALGIMALVAALAVSPASSQDALPASPAAEPVVHALLFYSPGCPHCREVIEDHLPGIVQRYGDRLRIAAVDVTTPGGQSLYEATVLHFNLPRQRIGVPTMVVGSTVLVGSLEIPTTLPALVEQGLANGGVDWPQVALVREALAAETAPAPAPPATAPPSETARAASPPATVAVDPAPDRARPAPAPATARETAAETPPGPAVETGPETPRESAVEMAPETPLEAAVETLPGPATRGVTTLESAAHAAVPALSLSARFLQDPVGNSAAVITLLLLVAALAVGASPLFGRTATLPPLPRWVTPVLAAAGMAVAAYLAFVEVTGAEAVCGPVGDCNTVQQSEFARLFGVPIGVLGMAAYAALLLGWTAGEVSSGPWNRMAPLALWGMALLATLFSTYLTFLEPFVIGATCAWCLSSALIAGSILLATTGRVPARARV